MERLLLVDACKFYQGPDRLGPGAWNETTLEYDVVAEAVLYEGECSVGAINNFPSVTEAGGAPQLETNYYVKIPVGDVVDIQEEDRVVVTAIHEGGDPLLVGQVFVVQAPPEVGTYALLRAVRVKRFSPVPQ